MPYFMILMTFLLGFDPTMSVIGTVVGHLYYFLEEIVPNLQDTQDCRVLKPPRILKSACDLLRIHDWNNMRNREGWFANEQGLIQDEDGHIIGNEQEVFGD